MGRKPVGPPGELARALAETLATFVIKAGGDRSGRWLAERTSRGKTYWHNVMSLEATMTVNDVAEVAEVFGISPLEFTRRAMLPTGLKTHGLDLTSEAPDNVTDLRQWRAEAATPEELETMRKVGLVDPEMEQDEDFD